MSASATPPTGPSKIDSQHVAKLERMLGAECLIYKRYLAVLKEERRFIIKFDSEKITALCSERGRLCDEMQAALNERTALIKSFVGHSRGRLSDHILQLFKQEDAQRLMPKVEELRKLVEQCHAGSKEFKQVIEFSLKLVSGLVSIIWSATQNLVKSYTQSGTMRESYHPTTSRQAAMLRKA